MFSGTIKISNIDDYVVPSKECVKPLQVGKIVLKAEDELNSVQLKTNKLQEIKIGKITLNDCLSCSGCVTSSESVLLESQSLIEFLNKIQERQLIIITISPQVISSLAHYYNLSYLHCFYRLSIFFKQMGITHVLDQQSFIIYTLELTNREWQYHQNLPLISSECPGWICFAEKLCPQQIIKHLSKVKSVQQIMANYIKHYYYHIHSIPYQNIFIVNLMQCYDKKLEPFRYKIQDQFADIDLVLTTKEVQELIESFSIAFSKNSITNHPYDPKIIKILNQIPLSNYPLFFDNILYNPNDPNFIFDFTQIIDKDHNIKNQDNKDNNVNSSYEVQFHINNSFDLTSNGFLYNLIRHIAVSQYQMSEDEYKIKEITGRNQDLIEYQLIKVCDDSVLVTFAKMYGLRNIQNLVRNSKKGSYKYDYIEVMSCPGGCLNGGGQLKPKEKNIKPREIIPKLIETMTKNMKEYDSKMKKEIVMKLESIGKKWLDTKAEFKHVGSDDLVNPQSIKW